MMFKSLFYCASIAVLAVTLSGCQSARKALNFDTSAVINFSALNNINPDSDDRASPVVVHVFKLADDRQFSREDFLSLYEGAEARLGKDLLGSVVLKEITPGESRTEVIGLPPEVKFIGLMAEFIQYRNADAIMVFPIVEHNQNIFDIAIDSNKLSVYQEPENNDPHEATRPVRSDRIH